MEIQQSEPYAEYMRQLKWHVHSIDDTNIFFRRFPFWGGMAKIHRPINLPNIQKFLQIAKKYNVRTLVIEPAENQNQKKIDTWCHTVSKYITISREPYLPTKTIKITLTPNEQILFSSLSEAKRRAVRRATKLGVIVRTSGEIHDLIRIKNKSAGLFGFITTTGIRELWNAFSLNHSSILLAYDKKNILLGGVLLIHWDKTSYYWIAGATNYGKKLYAPTILAWESMLLAKQKKSTFFDFVGAWDERIPKKNTIWKGFTKFKEGFGGYAVYYPLVSH